MVLRMLKELSENYKELYGNYKELSGKKDIDTTNKNQEEMKTIISEII